MNPQEINRRIAIACGWKHKGKTIYDWESPEGDVGFSSPNYHGDLNAMHEAEQLLTYDEWIEWLDHMGLILGLDETKGWDADSTLVLQRATATQRAEAFLRTIGQWEEGE
jgi:hypothetical protein